MAVGNEQGISMKVAKLLLKYGHCNGSAVVSPLPVYQSSSDSSSGGLTRCRGGRRAADKIIGMLGPENREQQRQIHALLEQSRIHVNSDSDSDDNSELEDAPSGHRKPAHSSLPPFKVTRSVLTERPSPQPDIQARQKPRETLERRRDDSFQFPLPASPPVYTPVSFANAQRFPLPVYTKISEVFQHSSSYYPPSVYHSAHSPWYTPVCSPRQLSDRDVSFSPTFQEPPRRSFARNTAGPSSACMYPEPQSPYMSPRVVYARSPYQSFCPSPAQGEPEVQLCEMLGCGSYGAVYRGEYLQTGQRVAVKVLHGEDVSAKEIFVLSCLDHQNIVKYLGTTTLKDGRFAILLELMKCSLASFIRDSNGLGEPEIRRYTRQILYGLEYLHRRNIVHRDIKCANILLDASGMAKLTDFGLAKKIDYSFAKSCKGTFFYMAPEVLLTSGQGQYGLAADIWSLGCTLIEMAGGKPPWSGFGIMPFYESMRGGHSPPIPSHLSLEAVDFIKSCLTREPKERPTASTLLRHPFVTKVALEQYFVSRQRLVI